MTFKDEMRAAGAKPDGAGPGAGGPGSGPESEDIAQLLRALNEDLHAEEDEDLEAETADSQGIGLPLGKIAAALFAAVGVGAVAIMLNTANDPGPVQTASVPVAQQAQTQAPPAAVQPPAQPQAAPPSQAAAQTAAQTPPAAARPPGTPEPLIARGAAGGAQPPALAPAPPPAGAAPAAPPPALKMPEPPPLPPLAAQPRTAAPQSAGTHTVPKAPEAPPPAAAEPAAPHATAQKPDTAELQAMLAPPKEAARPAARPAPAEPAPRAAQPAAPAPRAAAPTAPTASGPVPAGRYTVQLGTFQQAANADALVTKLKAQGFQAYAVSWTDGAQRSWRAVRVGGYGDQAAAKQAAGEVKAKTGLDSIVVSTTR